MEVPPCGLNKLVKMIKKESEVILVTGEFLNNNNTLIRSTNKLPFNLSYR